VQPRLELAACAGPKPLRVQASLAHQLEPPPKLLRLVAVEGDVQRPEPLVARLHAARVGQLGGEGWPGAVGVERQAEQLRLAPGRLPDRRQHPRGDTGGARPGLGSVEHAHREPALRGAPGAGEPDNAGADDERVESVGIAVGHWGSFSGGRVLATSLRRHYPDQVQTVGGRDAALSAPW
jgi:hypothetical protein